MKRLTIDNRGGICSTCCQPYTHIKLCRLIPENDPLATQNGEDLKLTTIISTCSQCRSLLRKIQKLQDELKLRAKQP